VTGPSAPKKPPKAQPLPTPQDASAADMEAINRLMRRRGFAANLLTGASGGGLGGRLGPVVSSGAPVAARTLGTG
jgi:hypothetical protein